MKKIVSIVTAALMMLTMVLPVFGQTDTSGWKSDETTLTVKKTYTLSGGTVFPSETLNFTSEADQTNPDTTNVTVDPLTVTQREGNEITVKVPSYSKVGVYKYTLKETKGSSQGVTYTEEPLKIVVLVEYDYDHQKLKATPQVDKEGQQVGKDTFMNTYDMGNLTVNKTVTGNLADKSKLFTIHVTLNAKDTVNSDITVNGGSDASNNKKIDKGWIGEKTVDIKLKHEETVTFSDVPAGVTYKVAEDASHTSGELNSSEGYKASYTNETGSITKETASQAKIVNEKKTAIQTGISLDNLPYILMVAFVLVFAGFMIVRRRRQSDI